MEQVVEGEDEGGAEEDEQGDAPAGLAIDFGEEIGARDVKGDAAGQRESVLKLAGEEAGQEDARERSQAEAGGGLEGAAAALPAGEDNGGHGKTFGELVEKHGEEEEHTERTVRLEVRAVVIHRDKVRRNILIHEVLDVVVRR